MLVELYINTLKMCGNIYTVCNHSINDDQYKKSLFNIPPTELIYPYWILVDWESNYKFDGAGFTDK